jgi:hypothetical protein
MNPLSNDYICFKNVANRIVYVELRGPLLEELYLPSVTENNLKMTYAYKQSQINSSNVSNGNVTSNSPVGAISFSSVSSSSSSSSSSTSEAQGLVVHLDTDSLETSVVLSKLRHWMSILDRSLKEMLLQLVVEKLMDECMRAWFWVLVYGARKVSMKQDMDILSNDLKLWRETFVYEGVDSKYVDISSAPVTSLMDHMQKPTSELIEMCKMQDKTHHSSPSVDRPRSGNVSLCRTNLSITYSVLLRVLWQRSHEDVEARHFLKDLVKQKAILSSDQF